MFPTTTSIETSHGPVTITALSRPTMLVGHNGRVPAHLTDEQAIDAVRQALLAQGATTDARLTLAPRQWVTGDDRGFHISGDGRPFGFDGAGLMDIGILPDILDVRGIEWTSLEMVGEGEPWAYERKTTTQVRPAHTIGATQTPLVIVTRNHTQLLGFSEDLSILEGKEVPSAEELVLPQVHLVSLIDVVDTSVVTSRLENLTLTPQGHVSVESGQAGIVGLSALTEWDPEGVDEYDDAFTPGEFSYEGAGSRTLNGNYGGMLLLEDAPAAVVTQTGLGDGFYPVLTAPGTIVIDYMHDRFDDRCEEDLTDEEYEERERSDEFGMIAAQLIASLGERTLVSLGEIELDGAVRICDPCYFDRESVASSGPGALDVGVELEVEAGTWDCYLAITGYGENLAVSDPGWMDSNRVTSLIALKRV